MIRGMLHSDWGMMWLGAMLMLTAARLDAQRSRIPTQRAGSRSRTDHFPEVLAGVAVLCLVYATYLALT